MATRTFIEESGVGSRWEFDKKTLFGLVDHVARVGTDVANIAKVRIQPLLGLFGVNVVK